MSLQYEYCKKGEGIEVIPFGPSRDEWVEPEPYFAVSGEQKEVHAYLDAVSSVINTKFSVFYDMRMESKETAIGFSDALVNLVFCFDPTNSLDEYEFKARFITPFKTMFI